MDEEKSPPGTYLPGFLEAIIRSLLHARDMTGDNLVLRRRLIEASYVVRDIQKDVIEELNRPRV